MLKNSQIDALAAFQSESESLTPLIILQVLWRLDFIQHEPWEIKSRMGELRIDRRFAALLTGWHGILHQEGMLLEQQGEWCLGGCAPCEMALEQRVDDARHRLRHFLNGHSSPGESSNDTLHADGLFASSETLCEVLLAPQLADVLLFSSLKTGGALLILEAGQDRLLPWITSATLLQYAANDGENRPQGPLLDEARRRGILRKAGLEVAELGPQVRAAALNQQRVFVARFPSLENH